MSTTAVQLHSPVSGALLPSQAASDRIARSLQLMPAVALAADAGAPTISKLVIIYRLNGLGGDRTCRELIRELESLGLLIVRGLAAGDKRERIVEISPSGWVLLSEVQMFLQRLVTSRPLPGVSDGR
jgi:hypothetical protein